MEFRVNCFKEVNYPTIFEYTIIQIGSPMLVKKKKYKKMSRTIQNSLYKMKQLKRINKPLKF